MNIIKFDSVIINLDYFVSASLNVGGKYICVHLNGQKDPIHINFKTQAEAREAYENIYEKLHIGA